MAGRIPLLVELPRPARGGRERRALARIRHLRRGQRRAHLAAPGRFRLAAGRGRRAAGRGPGPHPPRGQGRRSGGRRPRRGVGGRRDQDQLWRAAQIRPWRVAGLGDELPLPQRRAGLPHLPLGRPRPGRFSARPAAELPRAALFLADEPGLLARRGPRAHRPRHPAGRPQHDARTAGRLHHHRRAGRARLHHAAPGGRHTVRHPRRAQRLLRRRDGHERHARPL